MGLDVGSRTVGVAVSDLLGWTAQGIEIIRINEEEENFGFERLGELVKRIRSHEICRRFTEKNMNNSIGPRAEASMAYGDKIQELFQLPVDYQDERLTTVQAERFLVEQADASRAKKKKSLIN